MTEKCLCGSEKHYSKCCGCIISGEDTAVTAEALMRSRYTAYSQLNNDYLLATWHPSTRPQSINLELEPVNWTGLRIIDTQAGQADDSQGTVEFIARFKTNGKAGCLQECSRFLKEQGLWFYVDGEIKSDKQPGSNPGRNLPCPCASGKKYKYCCGR